MITINQVSKQYNDTIAVQDLNLEVADGEIVGIVGHNGAGKSTTLKMLAGLVEPTSGSIKIMGHDIVKDSVEIKKRIGYLPEESPLYENMTARQYLMFFSELYQMPVRQTRERIDFLLDSLKLDAKDRLTGEFSKGMKRKTAIARTLLHDPTLLILDEPNSGLDPLTSFFIINYLRTLRDEGKTILLSAHNLFHIEYICDRVAIIKGGRLVVFDKMEAIRASLGKREFQITFKSDEHLDYERRDGHYIFRTVEINEIAAVLQTISTQNWMLLDLSVKETALEEIYVRLMTEK